MFSVSTQKTLVAKIIRRYYQCSKRNDQILQLKKIQGEVTNVQKFRFAAYFVATNQMGVKNFFSQK